MSYTIYLTIFSSGFSFSNVIFNIYKLILLYQISNFFFLFKECLLVRSLCLQTLALYLYIR